MAFRFLKFKVYQDAKILHRKVVFLSKKFPIEFYYLKDQIRRSSLSIILQVAEGSANETAAALDVSFELGLIAQTEYDELLRLCEEVVNQLGGLSKKLLVVG